ncbi:MAG: DUF3822 family protein [Bacteroidetes bacterium]|nr:DUF3822 family protein [Bacteroidota bacterium]
MNKLLLSGILRIPDLPNEKADKNIHSIGMHVTGSQVEICLMSATRTEVFGVEVFRYQEGSPGVDETLIKGTLDYFCNRHPWFEDRDIPVTLMLSHRSFTLVPEPLFDNYRKEVYLEPLYPVQTGEMIFSEKIAELNAVAVYAIPWMWNQEMKSHFSHYIITHENVPLLGKLVPSLPTDNYAASVFLYLSDNWMKISLFNRSGLIFFNEFNVRTREDVLYYTLLSLKENDLDPSRTEVMTAGESPECPDLVSYLDNYFRSSRPVNLPWFKKIPIEMRKHSSFSFMLLFSLLA